MRRRAREKELNVINERRYKSRPLVSAGRLFRADRPYNEGAPLRWMRTESEFRKAAAAAAAQNSCACFLANNGTGRRRGQWDCRERLLALIIAAGQRGRGR